MTASAVGTCKTSRHHDELRLPLVFPRSDSWYVILFINLSSNVVKTAQVLSDHLQASCIQILLL